MKLLDAVNQILSKLGERAVTSTTVAHPTLAIILPIIEQNIRTTLLKGWWFNQYSYTAHPDGTGGIELGTDTLAFVPDNSDEAVQRAQRLFNPLTLGYTFTAPVKGTVTLYVAFDDLPDSAANYVMYSSIIDAYGTDMGIDAVVQLWQGKAMEAMSDLTSEHLRQKKYSTRKSSRWARLIRALKA